MSRFDNIDTKLAEFAKKFNTELSDGRQFHRKDVDVYEERRVRWTEADIERMALISPFSFDATSDNAGSTWNFVNIAWLNNSSSTSSTSLPMWDKFLVFNGDFDLIITHIDALLRKSEANLTNVKLTDLKKGITRRVKRKPGLQK